jgi:hypothetical protein
MRLSNAQVRDVLRQMNAQLVPADHPIVPQLEQVFGLHTFFLKPEGLHVVERGETPAPDSDPAFVVKIADWTDETHKVLAPQRYEVAGAIDIGPEIADLPGIDPKTGEIDPNADEQDPLAGHGHGKGVRGRGH